MKKLYLAVVIIIGLAFTAACSKDEGKYTTSLTMANQVGIPEVMQTLKPGQTQQMKAVVLPENAVNREVVWKSEDESIAKIDEKTGFLTMEQSATPGKKVKIIATLKDNSNISGWVYIIVRTPKPPVTAKEFELIPQSGYKLKDSQGNVIKYQDLEVLQLDSLQTISFRYIITDPLATDDSRDLTWKLEPFTGTGQNQTTIDNNLAVSKDNSTVTSIEKVEEPLYAKLVVNLSDITDFDVYPDAKREYAIKVIPPKKPTSLTINPKAQDVYLDEKGTQAEAWVITKLLPLDTAEENKTINYTFCVYDASNDCQAKTKDELKTLGIDFVDDTKFIIENKNELIGVKFKITATSAKVTSVNDYAEISIVSERVPVENLIFNEQTIKITTDVDADPNLGEKTSKKIMVNFEPLYTTQRNVQWCISNSETDFTKDSTATAAKYLANYAGGIANPEKTVKAEQAGTAYVLACAAQEGVDICAKHSQYLANTANTSKKQICTDVMDVEVVEKYTYIDEIEVYPSILPSSKITQAGVQATKKIRLEFNKTSGTVPNVVDDIIFLSEDSSIADVIMPDNPTDEDYKKPVLEFKKYDTTSITALSLSKGIAQDFKVVVLDMNPGENGESQDPMATYTTLVTSITNQAEKEKIKKQLQIARSVNRIPIKVDSSGSIVANNKMEIGQTHVTYRLWEAVKSWATTPGEDSNKRLMDGGPIYTFVNSGEMGLQGEVAHGQNLAGGDLQPVTNIIWRDAAVWCNAYSEWLNYNLHGENWIKDLYGASATDADYTEEANYSNSATSKTGIYKPVYVKGHQVLRTSNSLASTQDIDSAANLASNTRNGIRLIRKAEWEKILGGTGEQSSILGVIADSEYYKKTSVWHRDNTVYTGRAYTHPVASIIDDVQTCTGFNTGCQAGATVNTCSNDIKLCDVHGNVWQYLNDLNGLFTTYTGASYFFGTGKEASQLNNGFYTNNSTWAYSYNLKFPDMTFRIARSITDDDPQ